MNIEPRPISEVIEDISESDHPATSTLAELSGMDREDVLVFRHAWEGMPAELRLKTINRLAELIEDNIELNFDPIFKLGLRDPDAAVRARSIDGLWENEESSLIGLLLDLLANDPSETVQAAAAIALGRFTLLAECGTMRPRLIERALGELLHTWNDVNRSEEVRRRALEALAPLSLPQASAAINDAYHGDNPRLKVSALFAMGKSCDPAWLPALLKELGHEDPEMRFEAATALGELGDETAVDALIERGADPDAEVATAVIGSLGKIGGKRAKDYLQGRLDTRDPAVREAVLSALDEVRAKEDPLTLRL